MKKLVLITCLMGLAACGLDDTVAAKQDCNRLNYAKGTPQYDKCVVDMKAAEKLDSQNKSNLK